MSHQRADASRVAELFGRSTRHQAAWKDIVASQECPFTSKRCYKVRKSDPSVSIGTCTVCAGREMVPLVICPVRFLAAGQVFTDTLHLLTNHEPGNEYHIVSEVQIPGGSVDYFLVSVKESRPVDFVGIEFQALDTTGTVWPHRQDFLAQQGVIPPVEADARSFGVNWKMTAKTVLVQLHHKIETFEAVNRKLVLVLQDRLMRYMAAEFSFGHLAAGSLADSMHFHAYRLDDEAGQLTLRLDERKSTDEAGIATALKLGQTGKLEIEAILDKLQAKISDATRWQPVGTPPAEVPRSAIEPTE